MGTGHFRLTVVRVLCKKITQYRFGGTRMSSICYQKGTVFDVSNKNKDLKTLPFIWPRWFSNFRSLHLRHTLNVETRTYIDVGKITRFWIDHIAIIINWLYSTVNVFLPLLRKNLRQGWKWPQKDLFESKWALVCWNYSCRNDLIRSG